jgi:hypothetical protein
VQPTLEHQEVEVEKPVEVMKEAVVQKPVVVHDTVNVKGARTVDAPMNTQVCLCFSQQHYMASTGCAGQCADVLLCQRPTWTRGSVLLSRAFTQHLS